MAVRRIALAVDVDETTASFATKLDNLGVIHSHLSIDQELKQGFKGQTIIINYDSKDMKWFATKWTKPS